MRLFDREIHPTWRVLKTPRRENQIQNKVNKNECCGTAKQPNGDVKYRNDDCWRQLVKMAEESGSEDRGQWYVNRGRKIRRGWKGCLQKTTGADSDSVSHLPLLITNTHTSLDWSQTHSDFRLVVSFFWHFGINPVRRRSCWSSVRWQTKIADLEKD